MIRVGQETLVKPNSLEQAVETRDAIAMNMYHRLFNWLMERFNELLKNDKHASTALAVLDMCGAEDEPGGT